MNHFQFIKELHSICSFQSREGKKYGLVSNKELERWFQRKSVIVNGIAVNAKDEVVFPIQSYVLFPNNPVSLC